MLWRVSSSGSREQSGHMKGRRKRPGSTFCRMDKETRSAASARTIGRQECDRRRATGSGRWTMGAEQLKAIC